MNNVGYFPGMSSLSVKYCSSSSISGQSRESFLYKFRQPDFARCLLLYLGGDLPL